MRDILCCIACLTALQIEAAAEFNDTNYYFPDYEDDETKPVEVNSVIVFKTHFRRDNSNFVILDSSVH